MKIMVMRHADALTRAEAQVAYDAQRPLSSLGRRQAELMGRALSGVACIPEPVLTSPFIRTQETAAIICNQLGTGAPQPLILLAPGSGTDDLLRAAVNYGNPGLKWVLAVMHEPDISLVLGRLLYGGKPCPFTVQYGDLYALEISFSHGQSSGQLRFFLSADFLEDSTATTLT